MEEEKKQVIEEKDEFSPEPSIDEMIESSALLNPEPEKESEIEEKPETEEEKTETEKETKVEEKESESKDEKKEVKEEGLTEEGFTELAEKHPVLKEYKKFFDNYHTWEDNLTKRGQAVSWLTKLAEDNPEQYEALQNKLMPYVYGKEKLPKTSKELVEEMVKTLPKEGIKYVDDDELEVDVPYEKLGERDKKLVEAVLTQAVPEMAELRKKLNDNLGQNKELEERLEASTYRQGELEMESLVKKHKLLDIQRKDDETILEAVSRIGKAGEDHPEFNVLAKWNAIGKLADENGWKLDRAYEMLYGAEERKLSESEKTEEVLKKNQQEGIQETPDGIQPKPLEDWEKSMEGIGDRHTKIEEMFND